MVTGCAAPASNGARPTVAEITPTPLSAETPLPSVTPLPAAALINGEAILLSDYEAELERYRAAQPEGVEALSPAEQRQKVLDALTDQALLAQAAKQAGYTLDDAALDERIRALATQLGDEAALADWQQRNGYTPESFRAALRTQLAAAWQRDQIAASVPQALEQLHARQILVLDEALAKKIHDRLDSGAEFATLARQYDPVTGGELGWFPAGFLTQPQVEAAAFALQPGEYSEVIHTALGYQIVQVLERDPSRPLTPEARRMLQQKALRDWLQEQRERSRIEIRLP